MVFVVGAGQGWSDAGSGHLGVVWKLGPLQECRAPEAVSINETLPFTCFRLVAGVVSAALVLPAPRAVP